MKSLLLKLWRSATQRVMSLTFLGMLVGLLVDVLIAARLGTGESADALIIALSFPLFVDTVTRESAKSSLVPLFVERYEELDGRAYWRFVSGMVNGAVVLGVVGTVVTLAAAGWITTALGPGLEPAGQQRATLLLRLGAPMLGAAPAITLLSVVLNSQERFSVVALRNAAAPSVVVVAFALSWNRPDTVLWVAGGYSVGFLLFAALLFRYGFRGGTYVGTAWPSRAQLAELWHAVRWPSLGVGVRQVSRLAERAIASLVVVGGVSAYYFAFRIFSAAQTLVGLSAATTSLPTLSKLNVRNDLQAMSRVLRKRLGLVLGLGTLAALPVLGLAEPIVGVLYGRAAFDAGSVNRTAQILFWLGWAIPLSCATPVLTSGLFARKAYRLVALNMVLAAGVNIALAALFAQWLGLIGIAIGVVLAFVFVFVFLNILLSQQSLYPVFNLNR